MHTHTSHYILRRRISMCTHYSGGDVSVVSFWTVFGQTKIRQLRSVILKNRKCKFNSGNQLTLVSHTITIY